MRNAIDIRRFQDDSAVLSQRVAVLVADADVRSESASIYSRSVPCQAMPLQAAPLSAHCANHLLVGLAAFARAEGQAPRANPMNMGTCRWPQATDITTQRQRVVTGGKCQGTSFGGTGRMSQGETPTGASVRRGERRPTCFG